MNLSSIRKALTIVALFAPGAAAPALADQVETHTQIVSTTGLDLHSAHGRAVLHHRIAVAARTVCGRPDGVGPLSDSGYVRCVTEAERQATVRADRLFASGDLAFAAR